MENAFDIAIIGGGINGAGIARDAAGRGLKVVLFEQSDLAGATSSASTKLIHGGLRYLEHYGFRLVREALAEREILARIAPHNIWPLRFILPHHKGLRPRWLLSLGLVIYDMLGNKSFARAQAINVAEDRDASALRPEFRKAFTYADCWTDDARLVVLNARDAFERGADIRVRTQVTSVIREEKCWRLEAVTEEGARQEVRAKAIVNAAGPWVSDIVSRAGVAEKSKARIVKGSHIVVPKIFDGESAFILQQGDGRIVFCIPYERDFTLIGTTDEEFEGDPKGVRISESEIAYLCAAASEYFRKQVVPKDVTWSYAGVRALFDDRSSKAQEVTRDYVLALDANGPPILSIYGGKLTTYRRLAEGVLTSFSEYFPRAPRWTDQAPLPGGEFKREEFDAVVQRLRNAHDFLTHHHAVRLVHAYGMRAFGIFTGADDLGETFGGDLTAREVDYLVANEWAQTVEDVLWRRTKIGLRAGGGDVARLEVYLAKRR
ncbi:MAG: glycerol-3-phosphate dehydrogenase [Caulobacterales bacterium]